MAYRILVSLTEIRDGETEAPIASSAGPMASLEEGIAASPLDIIVAYSAIV